MTTSGKKSVKTKWPRGSPIVMDFISEMKCNPIIYYSRVYEITCSDCGCRIKTMVTIPWQQDEKTYERTFEPSEIEFSNMIHDPTVEKRVMQRIFAMLKRDGITRAK